MRTSLNNIKAIDDYILGRLAPGDALLFEANMLLDPDLANNVGHQHRTYTVIRQYSRQKLKREIAAVQEIIATTPQHQSFRHRIAGLFKKN